MQTNYLKLIFLLLMMMSTIMTISSNNWIGMWMGMEMNLMSFIPFIVKLKNKKSSKTIMMYFMSQSIGSIVFLFSIMMNSFITISHMEMKEIVMMLLVLGIIIKLGMAPFHMWLPEMMKNMTWNQLMFFMTWQKVAPLFVLSNMINNNYMIMFIIIMSSVTGAIGGINMTSLQKIMAFSSISHMAWIMMMMISKSQWIIYLLIYSVMMIMTCIFFNKYKTNFINQLNNSPLTMIEKYSLACILLSVGGMPPFLGFLPKWMVIEASMNTELMMPMMILLIMSLINLFYYMRMVSSFLLLFSYNNKWINMKKSKLSMILIINFSLPLFNMISFF